VRLFTPLVPAPSAPLARANPLAKVAAALVLMVVLFISVDVVTPAIVLLGLLVSLAFTGLSPRTLLARTWPLLVVAMAAGILNALFAPGTAAGEAIRIGAVEIEGRVATGLALGLRLLAIVLAGLLALVTTDPTELTDALVQQLRVSPRFAVGTLAALRLLPMLTDESQTIALARRARGIDAGWNPFEALQAFSRTLLALLVAAVRRATRLAMAMEARGFGSRPCRTVARPQRMRAADWALIGAGVVVAASAVGISSALGSWRFLLG
jgi:energy-coupling factor transport system permease protein